MFVVNFSLCLILLDDIYSNYGYPSVFFAKVKNDIYWYEYSSSAWYLVLCVSSCTVGIECVLYCVCITFSIVATAYVLVEDSDCHLWMYFHTLSTIVIIALTICQDNLWKAIYESRLNISANKNMDLKKVTVSQSRVAWSDCYTIILLFYFLLSFFEFSNTQQPLNRWV